MDVSRIKKRMIEELRATKEIISDTSISDGLITLFAKAEIQYLARTGKMLQKDKKNIY